MAINLSDNILAKTTAPADAKYGPYLAGTTAGATAAALTALIPTYRYEGLTIGIKSGTNPLVEYWFVGGTADSNLVFKATIDTNYYPTSLSWTNGTIAGPTATLTIAGGGSDVIFPAFPSASATVSGIVNTTTQTFVGSKTFNDLAIFSLGLTSTGATFTGNIQATGFKTPSGISSQFLKADGSIDGNSYATSSSLSSYLQLSGGTLTGGLTGTTASFTTILGTLIGNATTSEYFSRNVILGLTGPDIVMAGATVATNFSGTSPVLISTVLSNTGVTAGSGFNTFTVDAKGRITAASTTGYLTAETDTLSSVTGRGSSTPTAITITNHADSTNSSTGALVVQGGVGITGQLFVGGNATIGGTATIQGNLIVNGSSTVISSTQIAIQDAIVVLGGTAGSTAGDTLDKGIKYSYWNGSSLNGFFGYDQSTSYFSYYLNATESGGVISGTLGDMAAANFRGNLIGNATTSSNLSHTVILGLTGPDIVTTGATVITDFSSGISPILLSTTLSNTGVTAGSGFNTFTVDAKGRITAASTTGYLTAETDTLSSVTGRGSSTPTAITITNHADSTSTITGALQVQGGIGLTGSITVGGNLTLATAGTNINSFGSNNSTLSTTSATVIDTFPIATYRSGKYLIQVTQGSNYQISEITLIHNGTTTMMSEYGVLETAGQLVTFTSDITSGNARLIATMGSATSATIKVSRNLIIV